jgi:hypothetical protein
MEKKRANCPVCSLPADILEQLAGARTRKIHRQEQLTWLREEHGINLKAADFDAHHSGRHELAA